MSQGEVPFVFCATTSPAGGGFEGRDVVAQVVAQLGRRHPAARQRVLPATDAVRVDVAVVEPRQVQELVAEGLRLPDHRTGRCPWLAGADPVGHTELRGPPTGSRARARAGPVRGAVAFSLVVVGTLRGGRVAVLVVDLEAHRVAVAGLVVGPVELGLGAGPEAWELGLHQGALLRRRPRVDGQLDAQRDDDRRAHLLGLQLERDDVGLAACLGLQLQEPGLRRLLQRQLARRLGRRGAARWGTWPRRRTASAGQREGEGRPRRERPCGEGLDVARDALLYHSDAP